MKDLWYNLSKKIQAETGASEEVRLQYEHGLLLLAQLIEKTLIVIVLGFILGYGYITLVTVFSYMVIRTPLGGHHSDSAFACIFITVGTTVATIAGAIVFAGQMRVALAIYAISFVVAAAMPYWKTQASKKSRLIRTSKNVALVLPIILCQIFNYTVEGMVFIFTFFFTAIMLIPSFIKQHEKEVT